MEQLKVTPKFLTHEIKLVEPQNGESFEVNVFQFEVDGALMTVEAGHNTLSELSYDPFKLDGTKEVTFFQNKETFRLTFIEHYAFPKNVIKKRAGMSVVVKVQDTGQSIALTFEDGTVGVRSYSTKVVHESKEFYLRDYVKQAKLLHAFGVMDFEQCEGKSYLYQWKKFGEYDYIELQVAE